MFSIFLQTLPLALGGAVNPFGILIIFNYLSKKDQPLRRCWLFLVGSTVFLIVAVLIEYLLLHYTVERPHQNPLTSAIIDIVLGVLLLLLVFFRKSKPQKDSIESSIRPFKQLLTGFVFMIFDLSTLVLYFAALKIVFDAKLNFMDNTVIIMAIIIIAMSTMVLPVLLATIFPRRSAKLLEILHNFIVKRGQLVSKIVIFIIALYIIFKGLGYFWS